MPIRSPWDPVGLAVSIALALAAAVFAARALADAPPLDRLLAVAFVAEAGWADPRHAMAEADHRAIFHVLRKQAGMQARPFEVVVSEYVTALSDRAPDNDRTCWLNALLVHEGDEPPACWPNGRASWPRHLGWWRAAVARAERCLSRRGCRDPYRGQAVHWGGDMDPAKGCMVALPNAGTLNTFYAVDRECVRRREAAKVNPGLLGPSPTP